MGHIAELLREGQALQNRIPSFQGKESKDQNTTRFRNFMINGNVNAALRLLNNVTNKGVLPINDETLRQYYNLIHILLIINNN